jgi:ssDNA-binding Zn-finger/Zn-ribbon topoisomerase 1
MLDKKPCPSCGKDTLAYLTACEWCGAHLDVEKGREAKTVVTSPDLTKNSIHYAKVCTGVAIAFLAVGVLNVLIPCLWRGPMMPLFAVLGLPCALVLVILALGLGVTAFELKKRARQSKVCPYCRGELVLERSFETGDEDTAYHAHEYQYRCSQCGQRTVLIDG